jgi:hypothetical protein
MRRVGTIIFIILVFAACGKKDNPQPPPIVTPPNFSISSWSINGQNNLAQFVNIPLPPVIRLKFPLAINRGSVTTSIGVKQINGTDISYNASYENGDSVIVITPASPLNYLTRYTLSLSTTLKSTAGGLLNNASQFSFLTVLDSTDKFPVLSDDELLTLVQQQTFKYFWDFGHPVSGLARERNSSGDIVTTGGSGFGIMAIVTGISRNFITRDEGLARIQTIVNFLKNTAQRRQRGGDKFAQ